MARMNESLSELQEKAARLRDKLQNELDRFQKAKRREFAEEIELWFKGDIMLASSEGKLEKVEELMHERKRCLEMWR